jgi:hypothetical protein
MEWLTLGFEVWLLSGLVPSVVYMVARARKTYYVDPLRPLYGALQGPFAAWQVYANLKRQHYPAEQ